MLTSSDIQHLAGSLARHSRWGTAEARRTLIRARISDSLVADRVITRIDLQGSPLATAETALLQLQDAGLDAAGQSVLVLFLQRLAEEETDVSEQQLLRKTGLQVQILHLLRTAGIEEATLGAAYRQSVLHVEVDRYPNTAAEQVGHLLDLRAESLQAVPLLIFASSLGRKRPELAEPLATLTVPWARKVLGASETQIGASREYQPRTEQAEAGHVVALVVRLRGKDPETDAHAIPLLVQMYHWGPGQQLPREITEGGAVELADVNELAEWVASELPYALENIGTESPRVLVEFFLPIPLLALPVDTWEIVDSIGSEVLGLTYEVVVRSLERYSSDQSIARMRPRIVHPNPEIYWVEPPYPGERNPYALAETPGKGCIALSHTFCRHETELWTLALRSGMPWGIWVRGGDDSNSPEEVKAELGKIVGENQLSNPALLPRVVKQARIAAWGNSESPMDPLTRRVRQNLTLVFENPDRYPPIPRERRNPKVR